MMIGECAPGSLLAIVEKDETVLVELGGLLVQFRKNKKLATPWAAIVHTIDDQSLESFKPRSARCVDVDVEVLCVIALPTKLRELRTMNKKHRDGLTDNTDVDPVAGWTRGARAPGEAF